MLPDFKPLNPWGRPMPKPQREMQAKPPSLYQVFVERTDNGRHMAVGPKMSQQQAERFCEAIGVQIAQGKEKSWSTPTIVEFAPN